MKNKALLFLFVLLFLSVPMLLAQEKSSDSTNTNFNDTTQAKEKWGDWNDWDNEDGEWHEHTSSNDWEDWNFQFNLFSGKKHPTISVLYGLSQISLRQFGSKFAEPALMELKLGYTRQDTLDNACGVLWHKFNYAYVSNITTDLKKVSALNPDLETNLWRFGFGWEKGYGYQFGSSQIIPYHASGLEWSRLKMIEQPSLNPDKITTNYFDNSFRFGTHSETGIRINPIPNISLEVGYERAAIFPRLLFWKWACSALIEVAAQSMLDKFLDEVSDASPYAVPIVSALLKGALSYGIYELREEKMNYPFNSASPIMYNQVKFGMTFMF
ncbi:MAG: hypothetical protein K8H86_01735 [Ignavibacteriaceae bacterium]|nr:hypothetical protein [Ignavibacteriaceae bacterium]